jgi:hypothetical protein
MPARLPRRSLALPPLPARSSGSLVLQLSTWARASSASALVALAAGCGGGESTSQLAAPATVCPEGSQLDAQTGMCVARMKLPEAQPTAAPVATATAQPAQGGDVIRVSCSFQNGWFSVLPVDMYPKDDQFLMQALVGLTDEPAFWSKLPEYTKLAPFKAEKCTSTPTEHKVGPGDYYLLVGEADTFQQRNDYKNNGYKKRVTLAGAPFEVSLSRADLRHTWLCLSCPWVALVDPLTGLVDDAFVVLARRSGPDKRGTDRLRKKVVVRGGKVSLRLVEVDRETSYVDELSLEVHGRRVSPTRGGADSVLAAADGTLLVLDKGREVRLDYDVGLSDGEHEVTFVATGHYVPW